MQAIVHRPPQAYAPAMQAGERYRLPPLNALRAFEAAARHLSFTHAAQELCVSQGAISRHIQLLESSLGVTLFERRHRQVILTPQGENYQSAIRSAFEAIDEATSQIRPQVRSDTLKIRLLPTFAMRWLVPRLAHFSAENPGVTVRINTAHHHGDFDREDMEAAVEYGNPPRHDLVVERLFGEVLVPVCGPNLANGRPLPRHPRELGQHILLHSLHRPDFWRQWLDRAGIDGIAVDSGLRFENSGLCYQAAIDGLGIAIAHVAFVREDLARGRLVIPFHLPMRNDSGYYLVYPQRQLRHPKLRAFRQFLLRESAETERLMTAEFDPEATLDDALLAR
jgi:LysR family transcriptional regulator, glycine cleavage system transcriptional activator